MNQNGCNIRNNIFLFQTWRDLHVFSKYVMLNFYGLQLYKPTVIFSYVFDKSLL